MKIIFLTAGKEAPSSRFRVHQYINHLRRRGIDSEIYAADGGGPNVLRLLRRIIAVLKLKNTDIIFLQKPNYILDIWPIFRLIIKGQRKMIFDYDDAIFIDHQTGIMRESRTLEKIKLIMKKSTAVIAGNEYLSSYARQFNKNVYVLPTVIDTDKYYAINLRKDKCKIVGWIGTRQNLFYLLEIKDIISKLLNQYNIEFNIVSNMRKSLFYKLWDEASSSGNIKYYLWSESTEIERLNKFDIGLMPLNNNPYNRGKCGFKLLQYMSVNIPVVASRVGVNNEIVLNGKTGFLVNDFSSWYNRISKLIENNDLRMKMGAAGRDRVEQYYSVNSVFPKLYEIITSVI